MGIKDRWLILQDTINLDRQMKVNEMKETSKKDYTSWELFFDEFFMTIGLVGCVPFSMKGHPIIGILLMLIGLGSYGRILKRLSNGKFMPWWTVLWMKLKKKKNP